MGVASQSPTWLLICFGMIRSVFSPAVGWGSYFDHAVAWNKKMDDPNVKVVTYEDMKMVRGRQVRGKGRMLATW